MRKIRIIELFAGYGSQHLALKRLKRDNTQNYVKEEVKVQQVGNLVSCLYHIFKNLFIDNTAPVGQQMTIF